MVAWRASLEKNVYYEHNRQQFWRSTPQKALLAMPYDFISPTATEDQSEEPVAEAATVL
jgi:hypothetical protein